MWWTLLSAIKTTTGTVSNYTLREVAYRNGTYCRQPFVLLSARGVTIRVCQGNSGILSGFPRLPLHPIPVVYDAAGSPLLNHPPSPIQPCNSDWRTTALDMVSRTRCSLLRRYLTRRCLRIRSCNTGIRFRVCSVVPRSGPGHLHRLVCAGAHFLAMLESRGDLSIRRDRPCNRSAIGVSISAGTNVLVNLRTSM